MAYWISKYTLDRYHLADRMADPNPVMTWAVTRYRDEVSPGDTIFLWQTDPDTGKRGIYAVLRANAGPCEMAELESEQRFWAERDTRICERVETTIINRYVNLSADKLRAVRGLENLAVFRGFLHGTNFRVTPEEGAILSRMVAEQVEE
jgi:hypothetical protein